MIILLSISLPTPPDSFINSGAGLLVTLLLVMKFPYGGEFKFNTISFSLAAVNWIFGSLMMLLFLINVEADDSESLDLILF